MDSVKQIAATLQRHQIRYAATGLAGAWCLNHFAGFRLATVYHDGLLNEDIRTELGFREESRGPNVWLVSPNDAGVFQGAEARDGIQCAYPVQLYMDLKNQTQGNWLSVNGKRTGITAADFAQSVEHLGISSSEIDAMFQAVSAVTSRWPEYAQASGVGAGLSKAVTTELNR